MTFNFKDCTEEELWKFVATHLKEKGINTILVGELWSLSTQKDYTVLVI